MSKGPPSSEGETAGCEKPSCTKYQPARQGGAGSDSVLRLLIRVQPTGHPRHTTWREACLRRTAAAAECEQLAEQAITEEHRQTTLRIAATWRALADQRERLDLTRDKPPI
jgi:hypothetical protein